MNINKDELPSIDEIKIDIHMLICASIDVKFNFKENEEPKTKIYGNKRKLDIKSAADIFHEPTSHIVKELVSRV